MFLTVRKKGTDCMFDFFREVSMELRGIDVEEVEAKRKAKLEEKRKKQNHFSEQR